MTLKCRRKTVEQQNVKCTSVIGSNTSDMVNHSKSKME